MRTVAVVVGLALALVSAIPGAGSADELRPTVLAPNPFAMTPPPAPITPPQNVRPVPRPPFRPAPVVTAPCCVTGYWAYQWVPTVYTTYVWVPGYVSTDGTMVAGGYQPQVVTSGYYQPVWVSY